MFTGGVQLTTQSGVTIFSPSFRQSPGCYLIVITEDKQWVLVSKLEALEGMRDMHFEAARGTAFQVWTYDSGMLVVKTGPSPNKVSTI